MHYTSVTPTTCPPRTYAPIKAPLVKKTIVSSIQKRFANNGKMFGAKFMATLFGFALFSHQIGGFLGAYLGGFFFNLTGDYTVVWLIDAGLAVFASLIHIPIKESSVYQESLVN